jgi:vitamin B12 transporter
MKKFLCLWAAGFAALIVGPVHALSTTLDPVVVTATRTEAPLSSLGSSVTLITREDIENRQAVHLIDVLRTVPSLDVVRSGGLGQKISIFLRGSESNHTLVLIDGIEVNDPSTPGRAFDFAALSADNIERIEIVRGPGSTLYGSDAMGGVINIITRKGAGKPNGTLAFEGGSFKTHQEKFSLNGGTELVNYAFAGSFLESDGISAAGTEYGNRERDGYNRKSISARVGVTPGDILDVDFFYRFLETESDLDANNSSTWVFEDDPNNRYDSRSNYFRAQAHLYLFDQFWEQTLGFSLTDYDRSNRNDPDVDHPFDSIRSRYDSRLSKVDWQHNLAINQANTLTLGAEYEEETYDSTSLWGDFPEKSARTAGYYLQDQFHLGKNFTATAGLRSDDHSRFGSHETWRLTASYLFPSTGTRFKATYGTAFKAPTLFQLYSNPYGNRNLSPEKSRGWDTGIEQSLWDKRITFGATWFENRFEKLITFLWSENKFKNVTKARTRGLELTLSVRPVDDLTVSAGYTYTDPENRDTGDDLLRRPRNKYNLTLNYRLPRYGEINLDMIHVRKRYDYGTTKPLAAYTVVNVAVAYDLTENIRLTGRVENLFDENYEEVSGYGTPGIAGYLGASLSF